MGLANRGLQNFLKIRLDLSTGSFNQQRKTFYLQELIDKLFHRKYQNMKYCFLLIAFAFCSSLSAQKSHEYKVITSYRIASAGGWDYIVVHDGKLYVSHGTQVNILNEANGDSVG